MQFDHRNRTFTVGTHTYTVHENGSITNRHGRTLKPSLTKDGWPRYTFEGKRYMGAWLVASTWFRPDFTELQHIDGDLTNVASSNIQPIWDEGKPALKPSYGKSEVKKGDRNPNASVPLKVKTFIINNLHLPNTTLYERVSRMGVDISVSYIKKLRKMEK
jgi:hypothetical protein